jgi:hypothetical protein
MQRLMVQKKKKKKKTEKKIDSKNPQAAVCPHSSLLGCKPAILQWVCL